MKTIFSLARLIVVAGAVFVLGCQAAGTIPGGGSGENPAEAIVFKLTWPVEADGAITNADNGDITVQVPAGTTLLAMKGEFTFPETVKALPDPVNELLDYSIPQEFTISLQDGSEKKWKVSVIINKDSTKEIHSLVINGSAGILRKTGEQKTITVYLPHDSKVTALTPELKYTGASFLPAGAQDFSKPVKYTITAEDGSEDYYDVAVDVGNDESKAILGFTIEGQTGPSKINEGTLTSNGSIDIVLPSGMDKTALKPIISHTGVKVSPDSGEAQDFTGKASYTVSSAKSTTKIYEVNVSNAPPISVKLVKKIQADGRPDDKTTSYLLFSFGEEMPALSAEHFKVLDESKKELDIKGLVPIGKGAYSLLISGIEHDGDNLTVEKIADPVGYSISGLPANVVVHKAPLPVTFKNITANGSTGELTTTELRLNFDAPITLDIDKIITDGTIVKDKLEALDSEETQWKLTLSSVKSNKHDVEITLNPHKGYRISGAAKKVTVWKKLGDIIVPDATDLMVKFGIKATGYKHAAGSENKESPNIDPVTQNDVSNTILAMHNYLKTRSADIKLGDYFDLAELTISGMQYYNPKTMSDVLADKPVTIPYEDFDGKDNLLRIVVVGKNSFIKQDSYGGSTNAINPHIVMQLKNAPLALKMGEDVPSLKYSQTNVYKALQAGGVLYTSLEKAGIPLSSEMTWAPARKVAATSTAEDITEKLWLPTEFELFGKRVNAQRAEVRTTQAKLEYYTSANDEQNNTLRIKYKANGKPRDYWMASTPEIFSSNFCNVTGIAGAAAWTMTKTVLGVAPAFCVR